MGSSGMIDLMGLPDPRAVCIRPMRTRRVRSDERLELSARAASSGPVSAHVTDPSAVPAETSSMTGHGPRTDAPGPTSRTALRPAPWSRRRHGSGRSFASQPGEPLVVIGDPGGVYSGIAREDTLEDERPTRAWRFLIAHRRPVARPSRPTVRGWSAPALNTTSAASPEGFVRQPPVPRARRQRWAGNGQRSPSTSGPFGSHAEGVGA
jgi:hypothetical protein